MPLAVAGMSEERRYGITENHTIMPVAVETLGAVGPCSLAFLKELAARMRLQCGEERAPILDAAAVGCGARGKCCGSWGNSGWSSIRHFCVV